MKLSPEDKKKIYEEEKARLEAEKKAGAGKETGSNTSLKPNVAGTLCYLGAWISGIVFLIIERDNKTVRFHAMQSLFTFGILSIIIAIADSVRDWVAWFGPVWARPYYPGLVAANVVFGVFIAISVVLWLVLMYQTYHGRLIKLAFFGDIAEKLLCKLDNIREKDLSLKTEFAKTAPPPPPPPPAKEAKIPKTGLDVHLGGTRYSRIAHSVAAIVWSAIFLVFFNFFSRYFAVYSREAVDGVTWWHVYSLLTPELSLVLPILNITLILSIIGHSIIMALDKYLVRQITLIVLSTLGMITVITFLRVFPFDFSVVPNPRAAEILPTVAVVIMILISIGLGISALVRFVKLIIHVAKVRETPGKTH